MDIPAVGTRVMIRYRLPPGSVPPLTDVIGHLVRTGPVLQVRTRRGETVDVDVRDVVALKALTDAPVRTSDIRGVEHAAALAWPGVEREWANGWLLRFGHGSTRRANSAVPLDVSSDPDVGPVVDWYAARGTAPLIAAPDRLLRMRPGLPVDAETFVMIRDLASASGVAASAMALPGRPDKEWLAVYRRPVPVDVLTAVVDGELAFATVRGAAVARAALTASPDGTRWLGLSAVHVVEQARGRGIARSLCADLLAWGAGRGAHRAYVQTLVDNVAAKRLFESMGFAVQHRSRYVRADDVQKGGGW